MEKKPNEKGLRLERRDFLKLATGVQAAALLSLSPFASEMAKAAMPPAAGQADAAESHPKALNAHEWRTIRILADWIIPADERSVGAIQAGVPEFLDDWLDWKRGDLLDQIRGGITWLDMECNRSFQYDFADCSNAQQKRMLDRIAYPEKAAPEDAGAVAFFNTLRDLVVSGFFTSRVGIRDLPYVGNEPQSEWTGCPSDVEARLGVGKGRRNA